MKLNPIVNFPSLTLLSHELMATLKPLFIVNQHSQGFLLISIASLLYNLNVVEYIHYYTAFSIFAPNMRIFMLRLSFIEKSSTRTVILLVFFIVVFVSFLIKLSTQGINPFCIKESGILLSPTYRNTLSPNPYPNSTPLLCSLPTYKYQNRFSSHSTFVQFLHVKGQNSRCFEVLCSLFF